MLYQYHGNDMEVLREAACTVLAAAPLPPLIAEQLVVPNVGMAKWLRAGIAARTGIAANLRIESPAVFLDGLARSVLDERLAAGAGQAWSKEQLALRVMRELPLLQHRHGFESVARYLQGSDPQRRLYALSVRLAELYDRYLLYRPEWMLAWESGDAGNDCQPDGNAWQATLWHALVARLDAEQSESLHGARRLGRLRERLADGHPLDVVLPERVTGFGLGSLAPPFIDALAALATHTDVHLFQFNPCAAYWYDTVSERTLMRWQLESPARAALASTGNPLLQAWGTAGRAVLQQLLAHDDSRVIECFAEPTAPGMLGLLQHDLLNNEQPVQPRLLAQGDDSVVLAETHSRLREIEALQDHLLHLFATRTELRPRDIVVMAPDIGAYAGSIEAIFGLAASDPRRIPFTIADRDASATDPLVQGFLRLLQLPESRFEGSSVIALLTIPAIGSRFGIDAEALDPLREQVEAAAIRWGLDAGALPDGTPGPERNSWRFGLERLLLGIAFEEDVLYEGMVPVDPGGRDAIELTGQLAGFIECLERYAGELIAARPIGDWIGLLHRLLADFFCETPASEVALATLRSAIADVASALVQAGYQSPVERSVMQELLCGQLAGRDATHQFLRGGVNFCQLTPLRTIPFRVVCLLGMTAADFPRHTPPPAFDLISRAPRAGDPSRRNDDRYLFLEALLSARDCLYISRVARDERSNTPLEPALPVAELRDYIDAHWRVADDSRPASRLLTREHRLKPFDRSYFQAGQPLQSFRHEWLPALAGTGGYTTFCERPLTKPAVGEVGLATLLAFFRNPCGGFLGQRLGVRFASIDEAPRDEEPIALDSLVSWQLREQLIGTALGDGDILAGTERITARGVLPHGHAGALALEAVTAKSELLLETAARWSVLKVQSRELQLEIGNTRLHGTLGGLRDGRLLQITASKRHGGSLLPFWIRHLFWCAGGCAAGASELCCEDALVTLPLLESDRALALLAELLDIHEQGLCQPLPLFPKTSHAYAQALRKHGDAGKALGNARKDFHNERSGGGEGADPYVLRAFPDPEGALDVEFRALAVRVFAPLLDQLDGAAP